MTSAFVAVTLLVSGVAPAVSADIPPEPPREAGSPAADVEPAKKTPPSADKTDLAAAEDGKAVPYTDIELAFAKAKAVGKPVYVHWTAPWCVPCKKIKAEVYPRPKVAARLAAFVRAEIDIQTTDAGRKAWKDHVLKRDKSARTGGWAQPPLPSMLIYKDGVEVEGVRMTGSLTEETILVGLDRAIAALGLPAVKDEVAKPKAHAAQEKRTEPGGGGCAGGAGSSVLAVWAMAGWVLLRRSGLSA